MRSRMLGIVLFEWLSSSNGLLYIAMRRRVLLLTLLAAVCFSQEPVRVKVNLINVSFSVRDSCGALVENLTKDDFEVLAAAPAISS
jgi:hypothetical protein